DHDFHLTRSKRRRLSRRQRRRHVRRQDGRNRFGGKHFQKSVASLYSSAAGVEPNRRIVHGGNATAAQGRSAGAGQPAAGMSSRAALSDSRREMQIHRAAVRRKSKVAPSGLP